MRAGHRLLGGGGGGLWYRAAHHEGTRDPAPFWWSSGSPPFLPLTRGPAFPRNSLQYCGIFASAQRLGRCTFPPCLAPRRPLKAPPPCAATPRRDRCHRGLAVGHPQVCLPRGRPPRGGARAQASVPAAEPAVARRRRGRAGAPSRRCTAGSWAGLRVRTWVLHMGSAHGSCRRLGSQAPSEPPSPAEGGVNPAWLPAHLPSSAAVHPHRPCTITPPHTPYPPPHTLPPPLPLPGRPT